MPKSLWLILQNLPPIDLAAVAIETRARNRKTQKGDKRPRAEMEAQQAAMRRNKERKRKAATARAEARIEARKLEHRRKHWHARGTLNARLLRAMQPGHWYGRRDVARLAGVKWDSAKARLGVMRDRGWIEKAPNPDWAPAVYVAGIGAPWQMDRHQPPEFLYRLTPAGEAERARFDFLD